jgi:hypothetical protein
MPLESWNLVAVFPAQGTGMYAHHVDLNGQNSAGMALFFTNAARSRREIAKYPAPIVKFACEPDIPA